MTADYPVAALAAGIAAAYLAATLCATALVRAGFPVPSDDQRLGCIDGLRGYLALSVVAHHFIIWLQVTRLGGTWSAPTVHVFNNLGAGGVALFFMTTGLVFYPRILAGYRSTSWPTTYLTRVFRIVPLILVSVALVTTVITLRTGRRPDGITLRNVAQWVTTSGEPPLLDYQDSGRVNAYVLWSLWFEWMFYICVLPVCAFATDVISPRLPSWTVPVALLVLALIEKHLYPESTIARFIPLFAVGMLTFECRRRPRVRKVLGARWMGIPAIASLAAGMVGAPDPYGDPQLLLYGFFFAAVASGNSLSGLLRTRGALLLGECSYGIYLLHGIVLSLLFVDASPAVGALPLEAVPALMPLAALGVVCIAPALYLGVERPAIRMGAALAKRLFHRPVRTHEAQIEVAP